MIKNTLLRNGRNRLQRWSLDGHSLHSKPDILYMFYYLKKRRGSRGHPDARRNIRVITRNVMKYKAFRSLRIIQKPCVSAHATS